jgi:hypothetical protein
MGAGAVVVVAGQGPAFGMRQFSTGNRWQSEDGLVRREFFVSREDDHSTTPE